MRTKFLSEVVTEGDGVEQLSPFNASIVLFTISGRCLSHQQQCVVERAYGDMAQDFLARHQWLDGILTDKTKMMLTGCSGDPDEPAEPMLLFTDMAAQATALVLSKAMQSVPRNHQAVVTEYEQRAIQAARNISQFSERLAEFSYFKVYNKCDNAGRGSTLTPFTGASLHPDPALFLRGVCAESKTSRPRIRNPVQYHNIQSSGLECREYAGRDMSSEAVIGQYEPEWQRLWLSSGFENGLWIAFASEPIWSIFIQL